MAVLVMVFAALVGVTFITVVAINIGQTGREEERNKARQAAQAGLTLVNLQLTGGPSGLKWSPASDVRRYNNTLGVPQAGDPDYVAYWTPFDQAQGWDKAGFVKFPDPRSTNPSADAPNYLVKVEKVQEGDADNLEQKDKTGALRITTIGLSPDDPSSFYKVVAYKAGPAQQPLTSAMRSVSNWDFENETVPAATTANAGSSSTTGVSTLMLSDLKGSFANKKNFYVIISSATGGNVRYAVVRAADALGTTLELAPTPTTTVPAESPAPVLISWVEGERVELAAPLGAPTGLDFNNNNTIDVAVSGSTITGTERTPYRISTAANTPGSIKVNGGLVLQGQFYTSNLRAYRQTSQASSLPVGRVTASGLIAVNSPGITEVTGVLDSGITTTGRLVASSNSVFPFAGTGTAPEKNSIVEDGANRIAGSPAPLRQVKPFTPPDITAGTNGFSRYRELTKYSEPANSTDPPQAAAYGYGKGIYINNPEDKEKVGTQEMNQGDFERLLFDPTDGESYLRTGVPDAATTNNLSLEQQHLRGWIAPDEFLPRGALVEINPNATLTITLDSITDGADIIPVTGATERFNEGPVPSKGWRDNTGALQAAPLGGVYRRDIPWPTNGIIFAEGNIRIRGKASTNPDRNLTVVSMNNIYIEDSIGAGNKKLLLLARKNVVANPTRIVSRPRAQTRVSVGTVGTTATLVNGALFNVGDNVEIRNSTNVAYRRITALSGNNVTLNAPVPFLQDRPVVRLHDPLNAASSRPFFNAQTPYMGDETHAMQRRFWLGGTATARIAMRHAGAESPAANIQPTSSAPTLRLGNKIAVGTNRPTPPPTASLARVVPQAEKILSIDGDGTGTYPGFPATNTITQLLAEITSRHNIPTDLWEYNASAIGGYGATPYRYLAGVGLRYKIDPTIVPRTDLWRELLPTATQTPLYMATSVQLVANGTVAGLQLENGAGGFDTVNQFGFSPDYTLSEDALTVDRSFYTPFTPSATGTDRLFAHLTTDSRLISGGGLAVNRRNALTWRFHETVAGPGSAEDTLFDETAGRRLPYYALGRVKLENLNQYNGNVFETLEPGYEMDINAYVYAQEGSWLVIPGTYFDERLKTHPVSGVSFIDLNNDGQIDPGEYVDVSGNGNPDINEALDFNRDGFVSREEQVGLHRYLRYNYKLKFTGAIMENKSAMIEDPDGSGPQKGFVADWTEKWANVRTTSGNFNPTPPGSFAPSTMSTDNNNYSTIEYNYDPSAALESLATEEGFYLPVSSELMYQTG